MEDADFLEKKGCPQTEGRLHHSTGHPEEQSRQGKHLGMHRFAGRQPKALGCTHQRAGLGLATEQWQGAGDTGQAHLLMSLTFTLCLCSYSSLHSAMAGHLCRTWTVPPAITEGQSLQLTGLAAFLLPPGTHHRCAPSVQCKKGSSALRALLNISLDLSPSDLSAFPARRPEHELHTTALRRCHLAPALHRQLLQELSSSISLLSPSSCYSLGFLNLP